MKIEFARPTRKSTLSATGFQKWFDQVNDKVKKIFVPVLRSLDMMLLDKTYQSVGISQDYCLASISDFNSLIAKSQEFQVPVFKLTDEQINLGGKVLDRTNDSKEMFNRIFTQLADMIVRMTSDEFES